MGQCRRLTQRTALMYIADGALIQYNSTLDLPLHISHIHCHNNHFAGIKVVKVVGD